MNQIKSLFAFLFMLVATLFTASDAQAFALGNHVGGFFLGTLDCAGVDDAGNPQSMPGKRLVKLRHLVGLLCSRKQRRIESLQMGEEEDYESERLEAGRSYAASDQ